MIFAHGSPDLGPDAFAPAAVAAGVVVRAAETLLDAAPYLVVGALVAAVLRGMAGGAAVRRFFAEGRWAGVRGWGLGLLLPLCSLGVLPVARELHRAGGPPRFVLSFALSAAVLNPLSLVYGLTLLEPAAVLAAVLGSLLLSLAVTTLGGRGEPRPVLEFDEPPATGGRRLAATALAFTQAWAGPPAVGLLVGVLGSAVLAGVLPHGLLQDDLTRTNPAAPAAMALVGLPAYVTPLTGMMQAGTLVRDGFSAGAAWVILSLGVGLNLGLLMCLIRGYGLRNVIRPLAVFVVGALVLAYVAHGFWPSAAAAPDHTHALDSYTRPAAAQSGNFTTAVSAELKDRLRGPNPIVLATGVAVSFLGFALRRLGVRVGRGPRPAGDRQPAGPTALLDRPVSGRWVAAVAVVGGLLVLGRLLYVYYPPPAELFEDMTTVRVEMFGLDKPSDRATNLDHVRRFQGLVRKLPPATVLRAGRLTPDQRDRVRDLDEALEALAESLASGPPEESIALKWYVTDAFTGCRSAFAEPPTP